MAFSTRLLSRSTRQVYSGQSILVRSEYAIPARGVAKGSGSNSQALKGDEFLEEGG